MGATVSARQAPDPKYVIERVLQHELLQYTSTKTQVLGYECRTEDEIFESIASSLPPKVELY